MNVVGGKQTLELCLLHADSGKELTEKSASESSCSLLSACLTAGCWRPA